MRLYLILPGILHALAALWPLTLKQVKKGGSLENVLYALSEGVDIMCLN